MFRITAYDRQGRQVALVEAAGGEITIGREGDRRMVLPSPSVSRRHARIVLDPPQPYIADEGSANGVLVNGVRIGGPTAIVPGVQIDVAEFSLTFELAESTSRGAPAPAASAAVPSLRLRAQGGPFGGRAFELPGGRVSIGRAIDNDLVFDDPSLSRKHAVVQQTGRDRVEIQDLGSSNGTWINGRKIEAAVVSVGDAVRFGDLMFVLEGETVIEARPAAWDDGMGYDEAIPQQGRGWLLYASAGAAVLVIAAAATFVLLRPRSSTSASGKQSLESIAQEVDSHLKNGKDRLKDKQFDAAVAEFDRTLELDPTNTEAKALKLLAASEPENDKQSRKIVAKSSMGGRSDLDAAARMMGQMPAQSAFHDPTAEKVAGKLVVFGEAQCKAKKYADCAWAICRAIELAPATTRATVVPPAAEAQLQDAEKRAAHEKGFVPCKKK